MKSPLLSFTVGALFGSIIIFTLYQTLLVEYTTVSKLPDGSQYTGERQGEIFHGKGRLEWPNGSIYKGEFQNGIIEGQGTLQWSDGSTYEGQFKAGLLHDQGVYHHKGNVYTGQFEKDQFHGQGEYTLANGDHYLGEFKDGYFHGHGKYTSKNQSHYTGEFVQGEFTGQGTYTGSEGSTFEGTFENWSMAGEGVYAYASGDKYTGDHSAGTLNGQGEYQGADGSHYKGEFKSNLYHGEGELNAANGDHYLGQFEYGDYHGKGTLTYAEPQDGKKAVTGTWDNGTLSSCEGCTILPEADIVEATLYNQNQLLDAQLNALQANNSDQIDMYFLGVASHGSQAVFRREILFVKNYFDTHFNTQGNSAVLINDRSTTQDYPLATATSVKQTLQGMAEKMDAKQDILFLFPNNPRLQKTRAQH